MFFKNGRERVLSIYHHFTELIRLSKIDCEKFLMTPSGLDLTTFGSPFPCYSRWAILTHVEIGEDSIVHIKIKDFVSLWDPFSRLLIVIFGGKKVEVTVIWGINLALRHQKHFAKIILQSLGFEPATLVIAFPCCSLSAIMYSHIKWYLKWRKKSMVHLQKLLTVILNEIKLKLSWKKTSNCYFSHFTFFHSTHILTISIFEQ